MEFLNQATLLAAGAVLLVQQILKLKVVPVSFANRYPVITNVVLSVIAAIIAVWQTVDFEAMTWPEWLILVGTISVVAAIAYNMTIRNSPEIKKLEGIKKQEG